MILTKLNDIKEPFHGQVEILDDGSYWRWDATEGWHEIELDKNILTMNNYEMNKQIIKQFADLTKEDLKDSKKLIRELIETTHNKFFMFLCKDIGYYTIFHLKCKAEELLEDILIDECAVSIGSIKAVDYTEDKGAIEIWLQKGDSVYCSYFFPYDLGVIECV